MRIIIEDAEAVERVRRRGGDKSATETVNRLIREADSKGDEETERRIGWGRQLANVPRADAAASRRAARKGARS